VVDWRFKIKAFCIANSENYWFWSRMTWIKRILLGGDDGGDDDGW
jgi:hypothetical protein